jgi:chemotaxis regulatin CheY-phosphate phosphatase CheZ
MDEKEKLEQLAQALEEVVESLSDANSALSKIVNDKSWAAAERALEHVRAAELLANERYDDLEIELEDLDSEE